MISFLETIKGNDPVFFIHALCGVGDITSHLARLPNVEKTYPNHKIVFLLGGYGKSPKLSKELIERQGYAATTIKNYIYHNQHQKMEDFIKKNYVKTPRGDIYEDWSFCKEIFQNEDPPFYKYPLAFPYDYKFDVDTSKIENWDTYLKSRSVLIKPFTTDGNAEGFDHDLEQKRFWSAEKWAELCKILVDNRYLPVFMGLEKDLQNVPHLLYAENIPFMNFMGLGIEETTALIKNAMGCITTNSWEWGIASRMEIATICLFLKNQFFIPIHTPQEPSGVWDNLYLETNPVSTAKAFVPDRQYQSAPNRMMDGETTPICLFEIFDHMVNNKERP